MISLSLPSGKPLIEKLPLCSLATAADLHRIVKEKLGHTRFKIVKGQQALAPLWELEGAGVRDGDRLLVVVVDYGVILYSTYQLQSGIDFGGAAFAAVKTDGSVVTWGDADYGGDSSRVAEALHFMV